LITEICADLEVLSGQMKVAGYELDSKLLLHDIEQREKKVDYVTRAQPCI
jgi:hypothetical protein